METRIMNRSKIDQAKRSPLSFSKKVITYLKTLGKKTQISQGDAVIRRGDPGTAFYVILSGKVEVRLIGEEGNYLPLASLGKYCSFGEMALLRDEQTSADIIALSDLQVLQIPLKNFKKALSESEDFRTELLVRISQNLKDTSAEAWTFFQRTQALHMLALKEKTRLEEPLISKAIKMRKVQKQIIELAGKTRPVLIHGDPGTGKLFVARKIHNLASSGSSQDTPFIVVDCSKLGEFEAPNMLFGSTQFGESTDRLAGFGAIHLAHRGTLVLQHIDELDESSQNFLSRYLKFLFLCDEAFFPYVRIIATTRQNPESLKESGAFQEYLWSQLTHHTLRIPSLKERKADILPLAAVFLKGSEIRQERNLSNNAAHALLSFNYLHNNVKELRESVELAALFSEEGEILVEHVFAGPKDEGIPTEYDIGKIPFIRNLIKQKSLVFLRTGIFLIFAAIIAASLFFSTEKIGRIANGLIWAVWEPVLIFLFLFFGHIWCTICPLSTVASWTQNLLSFKRPTANWIKKSSIWLIIAGFFLILWTEKVFGMTRNPFSTAILLLSLMAGAVICCLVYKREVWCRYICPLGALASGFSFSASLHVRAKPHICANLCTTHECYKGKEDVSGCTVFHHPLYISDSHNCKLCFRCLHICPHDSVHFYLRPFLKGVWFFSGFAKSLIPFALSVFTLSIIMLATHKINWIRGPVELTITALLAVFLGIILSKILPRILTEKTDTDDALASRAAFALMILAWGPLMAFQFANIPGLSGIRIFAATESFLGRILPFREVSLLVLMQLGIILLAGLLMAITLWRVRIYVRKEGIEPKSTGWKFLLAFSFFYLVASIYLVVI